MAHIFSISGTVCLIRPLVLFASFDSNLCSPNDFNVAVETEHDGEICNVDGIYMYRAQNRHLDLQQYARPVNESRKQG